MPNIISNHYKIYVVLKIIDKNINVFVEICLK